MMMVVNIVQTDNPPQVYIDNYMLPDGTKVSLSKDSKVIDLSPMLPVVGQLFEMHINGSFMQYCRLTGLQTKDGKQMILYDEVGMEEDDIALEEAEEAHYHRQRQATEEMFDEDE